MGGFLCHALRKFLRNHARPDFLKCQSDFLILRGHLVLDQFKMFVFHLALIFLPVASFFLLKISDKMLHVFRDGRYFTASKRPSDVLFSR